MLFRLKYMVCLQPNCPQWHLNIRIYTRKYLKTGLNLKQLQIAKYINSTIINLQHHKIQIREFPFGGKDWEKWKIFQRDNKNNNNNNLTLVTYCILRTGKKIIIGEQCQWSLHLGDNTSQKKGDKLVVSSNWWNLDNVGQNAWQMRFDS